MIKSNRGQLSIFMGITLILVMGMLAFIINVGLFVKAKINLQNAVDAAAYSGAATQARQLTNIAYANWEMRNTFKEWMFKYYVLGQLGLLPYNLSDSRISGDQNVSFLLPTPAVAGTNVGFDKYNVPSICIHNNSNTNICPIYALPGIPRFPAIGVAGISEIHEAFVNKLVEEKGADCSRRTQINFLAAISWAYSSGLKDIPGAPLVATNRPGAWPESLELAMRIRNLEMIVNRPPITEEDNGLDLNSLNALQSQGAEIGLNERPIKAFMSAFRNLGGGKYKDALTSSGSSGGIDELPATFKMFELAPQTVSVDANSVSGFLIPPSFVYPGGRAAKALDKHYLDLQLVPVNYATMFTTFATTRNEFEPSVDSEASCFVSKSAMPVPGYLLGFVKNPSVLTYYAVKGEARFTGLFFPRSTVEEEGSVKLTAYAAAKPYGGRIGPKFFGFAENDRTVVAREDENRKSNSYVSGLNVEGAGAGFKPGMPIPPSQNFWVNEITTNIGGVPGSNPLIFYGIPNMIYDFEKESDLAAQTFTGSRVQIIGPLPFAAAIPPQNKGLFHAPQFRALKRAIGTATAGDSLNGDAVMRAIVTARQATRYDAINYLIPDFRKLTDKNNIHPYLKRLAQPVPGGLGSFYFLFAPLVGSDLLYKTNTDVTSIVNAYMGANQQAIDVYLKALLEVGQSIFSLPSQGGSSVNLQAAQSIHANAGGAGGFIPPPLVSADPNNPADPGCKSDMASKFNHFFRGKNTQCGIVPLEVLMVEYIDKQNTGPGKLFYRGIYLNQLPPEKIMTAYHPGPRQGVSADAKAMATHPLNVAGAEDYSTLRNAYSTKFVQLAKVLQGAPAGPSKKDYEKEPAFKESDSKSPDDMASIIMKNPINFDETSGINKPYFLDF